MHTLLQDLRFGARMLFKHRGFTLIAILTLALGIGANTAIFSVVDMVLLRPLPYRDAERLVFLNETFKQTQEKSVSYPNYVDWSRQSQIFEQTGAYITWTFNLTGAAEPERLEGAVVSASLFPMLGTAPLMGRTFLPEEDAPGGQSVAVISYGLWQRRLNGERNVIGSHLRLDGANVTVIGVMPQTFAFPDQTSEVWMPLLPAIPSDREQRDSHPGLYVVGRLRAGLSMAQARNEMDSLARRLAQQYPASNAESGVRLVSLREEQFGNLRAPFLILMAAVSFVLLIACANIANLMLARASARSREIAIRLALGARRWRIVRQLLTESVLLGLLAGAAGVLLAYWMVNPIVALTPRHEQIPGLQALSLDGRVLGFTLGLSLLTGLLFGLVPALYATKPDIQQWLKGGTKGAEPGGGNKVRGTLIVAEVALSLVLLIGAGLMLKTLQQMLKTDWGFKPDQVLTLRLSLSGEEYQAPGASARFYQRLLERLAALPGVQAAGAVLPLPLGGGHQTQINFQDSAVSPREQSVRTDFARISPGYFRAMGIRLLQGREFNERDTADAPLAVIIDETLARQYFPNQNPLGHHLKSGNAVREIVGVVNHIKNYGVNAPSRIQMYLPFQQVPAQSMALALRTESDPAQLVSSVRRVIYELAPNQPVYNIQPMKQLVVRNIATERVTMILLGIFAVIALLLTGIGIYGVISYSVTQRTREIGIRMALGANPSDVLKLIVKQGMTLALIGVAGGLVTSFALTRLMKGLLFGVSATDPLMFALLSLLLTGIALLACYLPARRAMKIAPMVALRYE